MSMKLAISFPDQSTSFCYGVEYGRLLEKIERGDKIILNNGFPVRIENLELLKKTCILAGYTPIFGRTYYNEWIEFTGIKELTNN